MWLTRLDCSFSVSIAQCKSSYQVIDSLQMDHRSVLCEFLYLLLLICSCEASFQNHSKTCPSTWIYKSCACGSSLGGAVICNQDTQNVSLLMGYCMTYDNATGLALVGRCPYDVILHTHLVKKIYIPLPQNPLDLNEAVCGGPMNREGMLCGNCRNNFGPGVFSKDFNCYDCSDSYHGWPLYLCFELFPVTVLFFIVLVFHVRVTSASMNSFILISQIIVAVYSYNPPIGTYPSQTILDLEKILLVCYGFWNLDFFRQVIPSFCISGKVNDLHAVTLQYLAVLYLLCLTALTYICIELHGHNLRPIVWLWRPLHKYFIYFRRTWNPKASIIDAFATFLLLSYSRVLLASFELMYPSHVYNIKGKEIAGSPVVYYGGHIEYFSSDHLPFAIPAIAVLATIILFPPLLLILYPTKPFQKCLGYRRRRWHGLDTFADAFQGCYKDGTNGSHDCRYFAGLYLILRIALFASHISTSSWMGNTVPGIIFLCASIGSLAVRPYKDDKFNILDGVMMALLAVLCFFQTFSILLEGSYSLTLTIHIGLFIPLLYITIYIVHAFVRGTPMKYVRGTLQNVMRSFQTD